MNHPYHSPYPVNPNCRVIRLNDEKEKSSWTLEELVEAGKAPDYVLPQSNQRKIETEPKNKQKKTKHF